MDTPVKRYSSGMAVRLAFAVAAHLEPEILIVDEVLAVGDAEFQRKCLGKMGDVAKGRTVLFVSHNLGAVRSLCTRGIALDGGKVRFDGPTAEALNSHQMRREVTRDFHRAAVASSKPTIELVRVLETNNHEDTESVAIEVSIAVDRPSNICLDIRLKELGPIANRFWFDRNLRRHAIDFAQLRSQSYCFESIHWRASDRRICSERRSHPSVCGNL